LFGPIGYLRAVWSRGCRGWRTERRTHDMSQWTGVIGLRRRGGVLERRGIPPTLPLLLAAWVSLGGIAAHASAVAQAPAAAGVERFVIDPAASEALYRV